MEVIETLIRIHMNYRKTVFRLLWLGLLAILLWGMLLLTCFQTDTDVVLRNRRYNNQVQIVN